MLTGTVTVSLNSRGDVKVTGDNSSNDVVVEVTESGDVQVTGQEGTRIRFQAGGETVTVNADTTVALSSLVTLPDDLAFRSLSVDMKGGNDLLTLRVNGDVSIDRDVSINLGSGNDLLLTLVSDASLSIGRNLSVQGGSGNNSVAIATTNGGTISVGSDLTVSGGSQIDVVGIGNIDPILSASSVVELTSIANSSGAPETLSVQVGDDLSISTSKGDDIIVISSVAVRDDATIHSGLGHGDFLFADNLSVGDDVKLIWGDFHAIQNVTVGGDVTVDSGTGNDVFLVDHVSIGGRLNARLGGGNDTLAIGADVDVDGRVTLDGGSGNDRVVSEADLPGVRPRSFEGSNVDVDDILDSAFSGVRNVADDLLELILDDTM